MHTTQFTTDHYNSKEGMLTSVWGPSLWHFLHVISFNYPVEPTKADKKHYRDFLKSLQYILPCKYCRDNFKKNIASLKHSDFANRESFSKYMYYLHEDINTMLGKHSNLTYEDVRHRYEHFRSQCKGKKTQRKRKGCVKPLHKTYKKPKCILKIVPNDKKCPSLQVPSSMSIS